MHDIRALREDPARFDRGWATRGLPPQAESLLEKDAELRALTTRLQDAQTERNAASKEIGKAMGQGDQEKADALKARVAALKSELQEGEDKERALRADLDAALAAIPNLPLEDAPEGPDETANVETRRWGTPTREAGLEHDAIGEALGLLDFETAAKLSGARFSLLRGALARMERALAAFMLDLHTREFGYTEVAPPVLVRDEALFGTGQLPKFEDDQFRCRDDDLWLTPTAEVTLTNTVRETILPVAELPLRLTAWTQCFRREAGSAGRDTRGLIRLHQFSKVELVSIVAPENGPQELERMTACAEEVLKRLNLPYRVMSLCTGDLGFAARKTYDLEVWLPGQSSYREISSCSYCGDFQARRMGARFRPEGEKAKPEFAHTLNGSGLAVGRTMVAVLENYADDGGAVAVPEALQPYMGGLTRIERKAT